MITKTKSDFGLSTCLTAIASAASALTLLSAAHAQSVLNVTLDRGSLADYGASPWFTDEFSMGTSSMEFIFDTGTNLFWATTDVCTTAACQNHSSVDTSQSGFMFTGDPTTANFGPWGIMNVRPAEIFLSFNSSTLIDPVEFTGSTSYDGDKFKYLAWGGGIGLPSETDTSEGTNVFETLYRNGVIPNLEFAFYTDALTKSGTLVLGGNDTTQFDPSLSVLLPVKKSSDGDLDYLWGTPLNEASLGGQSFSSLTGGIFYVDSGSSRFKGGSDSIQPILDQFYAIVDSSGNPIFEYYADSGTDYTGLVYANGKSPSDYPTLLPDFTLNLGSSCSGDTSKEGEISLSADQYSYYVDEGDRKNQWVLAFHILEGIDGILVGSTFMDLVATTFTYTDAGTKLTQSNMVIYRKASGQQPAAFSCVTPVSNPPFPRPITRQ
ncbi:MAG: pepsin-like aspartic protease [Pseudomonadota bacterium]